MTESGSGATPAVISKPIVGMALALVVVLAVVNALGFCTSNQIEDDAFIFFRYVDNMLGGHGLTWNPGGERVEGYSSFLYVMALAPLRAAGADLATVSHRLNVALFVATALLGMVLLRGAAGRWTPASILAGLLVATSSQLAAYSRNGMESMLFAALIVLALWLVVRDGRRPVDAIVSGAVFGLVALTRPEGILVYLGAVAVRALSPRDHGGTRLDRIELIRLAGLLAVVVPHLGWRLAYYGALVPNTYFAKVGWGPAVVERGLAGLSQSGGLVQFLGTFRGLLAALALLSWTLAPRTRLGNLLALLCAGWIAYVAVGIGLPNWSLWYTMPIDLFAALSLAWNVPRISEGTARTPSRVLVALAVAMILVGNLSGAIARHRLGGAPFGLAPVDPPDRSQVNAFIAIGKKLGEIAAPGESVAVGACGAIPYYSELETIDVLGLNDRHIARTPFTGEITDAFGHEKGDGAYVLSRRPTYMIPLPILTPRPNPGRSEFERSFVEIFRSPEFPRHYEFKSIEIAPGQHFNYYERKR